MSTPPQQTPPFRPLTDFLLNHTHYLPPLPFPYHPPSSNPSFSTSRSTPSPQDPHYQNYFCPICLTHAYSSRERIIAINLPTCRHVFGADCFEVYIQWGNTCPLCRTMWFEERVAAAGRRGGGGSVSITILARGEEVGGVWEGIVGDGAVLGEWLDDEMETESETEMETETETEGEGSAWVTEGESGDYGESETETESEEHGERDYEDEELQGSRSTARERHAQRVHVSIGDNDGTQVYYGNERSRLQGGGGDPGTEDLEGAGDGVTTGSTGVQRGRVRSRVSDSDGSVSEPPRWRRRRN
ncbi:hypothetical protein K458DRAFT_392011 [Lentithecium fluviatile CBS 122367]|uniref:RING-type domain-containing protein n=1 Tax=Lentithecium fluviatile CBS 122367 TaxID=1168545 RepID=A0A6G1ITL8_9PLEO|nr:hypothetical protein K458DRAFT_392011 [Lentithecium fluviatile CBS 122367]